MRESNLFFVTLLPLLVAACDDGQRVPLGEQHTNQGGSSGSGLPTTGGSSSLPTTGGSSSLPTTGGSSSLPTTGGSSSLPTTGGSSSLPATGGSSSIPPTTTPCNVLTQVCNLTLDVKPYLAPCQAIGLLSCMLTRKNDAGDYGNFHDDIQGFSFEWGYEYRLKVETTPVPNPPADGSSVAYRLLELTSKTPVAAGTEFEVQLAPLVQSAEQLGSVIAGDCATGYTLFGKPLNFDAGMTCESFRTITSATIPNAVRLKFSTPEGPLSVVGTTPTLQRLELRPYLQACRGFGVVPCKWARTNGSGEFSGLSEGISGFEFDWGYEYDLVVSLRTLPNPPLDGSSREYTLVQQVQKTPVAPGTEFVLDMSSNYNRDNVSSFVSGNCTLGYKLLTTDGPELLFDGEVSCEQFANSFAMSVPHSIRFRFSTPGGPLSVVHVQELVQ